MKITTAAGNERSIETLEDKLEKYVKDHDVAFDVPIIGSRVTVGARNLDSDEVDLKINFSSGSDLEGKVIIYFVILLEIVPSHR